MKKLSIRNVLDLINKNSDKDYAIRGDDYIPKYKFKKSRYHGDDEPEFTLPGVSAIHIPISTIQAVKKAIKLASNYGKYIFLLSGNIHNAHPIYHDYGEVLVYINKIEGIIDYKFKMKQPKMSFKEFVEKHGKNFADYDFSKINTPEWAPLVKKYKSEIK